MANKLLHTCIRVGNLEKSIEFYQDVLGLVITHRKDMPEHGFALVYLSDEDGHYEIELTYNFDTDHYEVGNGFSHTAISVPNLELEHDRIKALGYEVGDLRGLPGNVPNYFFVTDPDGYRVEVLREK